MPTTLREKEEKGPIIHNLLSREIRPIRNWHEFLERWQAATTLEEMLGLLHAGLSVPLERYQYGEKEYDRVDRVMFYFAIAGGWADNDLLKMPADGEGKCPFGRDERSNTIYKTASELRQVVALKAFNMLCMNFFRAEFEGGGRDGRWFGDFWEEEVASDRLFSTILIFFRAEEDRFDRVRIRNLSRRSEPSHNEELARNFLLNLARFIWGWREKEIHSYYKEDEKEAVKKRNTKTRARLDAAKPWMVEVLEQLDRFDLLREWALTLDKPCLAKLKEIAFRSELSQHSHPVAKDRGVATLDEACYVGSPAAWFLKKRELKISEGKRLKAILEAKLDIEKADRKIKELTPR